LRVLGPGPEAFASGETNNESLVLKLSWRNVSFLLTGDIEAEAEEALLDSAADLRATVLKVAHHGSATSTSAAFLEAVQPAVAVVSVGANNPYGHPAPAVMSRLDESLVLRTDLHGTIELSTDGERLWIEPERSLAAPARASLD
jgi:beta-lactamase superfamily II metal-dependent hydrolase